MDDGHRAVLRRHVAKERQGNGVVPADRDETAATGREAVRRGLDLVHRFADVEGVHGDVPRVGHLLGRERLDVLRGIVRT